jgi:hypothetical protein
MRKRAPKSLMMMNLRGEFLDVSVSRQLHCITWTMDIPILPVGDKRITKRNLNEFRTEIIVNRRANGASERGRRAKMQISQIGTDIRDMLNFSILRLIVG